MRHLALIFFLAWASPAMAWDLSSRAEAELVRNGTYVDVQPDPGGASGLLRAATDIPAPPALVWQILVDCDLATRLATTLKSCHVLQKDPAGRWDIREQVRKGGLLPPLHSTFRSDYEVPSRIRFRALSGDFRVFEGEWRLIPLDGGRATRVLYEVRAASPYAVPNAVARAVLRLEAPQALAALKRECLARTARASKADS